jgi:hypothetical protein
MCFLLIRSRGEIGTREELVLHAREGDAEIQTYGLGDPDVTALRQG